MWVSDQGGEGQGMEEGGWDKCLKFLFSSMSAERGGEGATPCYQTASASKDGGMIV